MQRVLHRSQQHHHHHLLVCLAVLIACSCTWATQETCDNRSCGSTSKYARFADVVSEAESMLTKGLPVSDVVKMLAGEVKRLTAIVESKQ